MMKWFKRDACKGTSPAARTGTGLIMAILFAAAHSSVAGQLPSSNSIQGMAVTGFNRLLGRPVMQLGQLGGFGFDTVAAFNSGGDAPLPLTSDSADDTQLATLVDDAFLDAFYGDEPFRVDPASINVPLREVPTNTTPFNGPFMALKGAFDTAPYQLFAPGQTEPVDPVTLGRWLQARGLARIDCEDDDEATIDIIMGGLIPNRIYSVWGFFLDPDAAPPFKDFGPMLPLGGVPNLFVSDGNGSGRYKRVINFCPTDLDDGDVPMPTFFVVYHSDLMANGGVPEFPERSRFIGTGAHVQLQFIVE